MDEKLISPCGMNCCLCIAYQFKENDLNKRGFHKKYCPGCIPRGENCTHMRDACELLVKGGIRFCFECESFPCKRLKTLDKHQPYKIPYEHDRKPQLHQGIWHGRILKEGTWQMALHRVWSDYLLP